MEKFSKILILGGSGLVGRAIFKRLVKSGHYNLFVPGSKELNLLDNKSTLDFFKTFEPEYVFVAAAKVGGIVGNKKHPADYGHENSMIALNTLQAAKEYKVKKLLFLGSSCIYPKECELPIREDMLLTGPLEPTNELYALSKILGLKMCDAYREQHDCNFISAMPCNLYGPNDNFHPEHSHVLPALIDRFHNAKLNNDEKVWCWGDGTPMREFLFVDDLADACYWMMENYDESGTVNIGTGEDFTLKQVAEWVKEIVGFEGKIDWDIIKPNGTMRKVMDVGKLTGMGWKSSTRLKDGLKMTYDWYLANIDNLRKK